jgi:hypothetical protein
LDDYAAAAALLHATCNIKAPRTAALERVVVTILQLVLGMVSARSRYQLPRLVIRRAISSLFLAAPPPVLSLCLLRCKLRCVALLCCSLCQREHANLLLPCPRPEPLPHIARHAIFLPPSHTAHICRVAAEQQQQPSSHLLQNHSLSSARTLDCSLVRASSAPSLSLWWSASAPASGALREAVCHPRTQTRASPQFTSPSTLSLDRPSRHSRTILDASMRLSHRRP